MTAPPERPALSFSALQRAWMQELGIEKTWIPAQTRPVPVVPVVTQYVAHAYPATLEASRDASAPQPVIPPATSTVSDRAVPAPVPRRVPAVSVRPPLSVPDMPATATIHTEQLAAACLDLPTLAARIAQCQNCGLCKEREQVVVGQGVMRPAIMVIGEAPGDQEDRQGVPFVGRSGMLLDNMLSAIGSSRDKDVYTTNIIKCRPPGNRNPRPEEISACRPFLMRQIELVRPFSILALGRFAAHTLLGADLPLAEMRQQTHTLSHAGLQIPVVVSYHPAYLLRRPADKAAAWQDLQQIKAIAREYI